MSVATAERRRSDRLLLTVPLRVDGVNSTGQNVEYDARAISLNRHGARIQTAQRLERGQTIRLRSPIGHYEAEFRVVNPVETSDDAHPEYGIEYLNEQESFWGFQFSSGQSEAADAKVLLECRMCHTIALLPVTPSELDTLRSIGRVGKACQTCKSETPWKYADVRMPLHRDTETAKGPIQNQGSSSMPPSNFPVERGHRRVYMQMPLGIRDWKGSEEVAQTINVSQCGFCFSSEKKYLPGEIVTVNFPVDQERPQLAARIVREQVLEGSDNKNYGATFEPASCSLDQSGVFSRHSAA